ncbi:hypothetical protein KJB62_10175 [Staphylococcus saprophyticus]|uniref:hypothetical protein n=1 Tax=Staphylococcus saprophyticus TaxID=29385 RepID=UPI001F3FC616|nr:hypothetical protein [Staphylococcus saprophyticus]MCE5131756.1 hypothetical protein [Staphylococcus saprophyticus]
MNEIFVFIIETNDGNVFREYVENVLEIDGRLALERFEKAIRKHRYFYLKDSGRYINVSHIISIKVEIM